MTSQELDAAIESAEEDVIALRMIQDIKREEYEKACAATKAARKQWFALIRKRDDIRLLATANKWTAIAEANHDQLN